MSPPLSRRPCGFSSLFLLLVVVVIVVIVVIVVVVVFPLFILRRMILRNGVGDEDTTFRYTFGSLIRLSGAPSSSPKGNHQNHRVDAQADKDAASLTGVDLGAAAQAIFDVLHKDGKVDECWSIEG